MLDAIENLIPPGTTIADLPIQTVSHRFSIVGISIPRHPLGHSIIRVPNRSMAIHVNRSIVQS
jgi:hypothetical protein